MRVTYSRAFLMAASLKWKQSLVPEEAPVTIGVALSSGCDVQPGRANDIYRISVS